MSSQRQRRRRRARLYKPLNHDTEDIRLISISPSSDIAHIVECTIQTVQLSSAPHYEALSYLWGDPDVTKEIFVGGVPIHVTTNLWAALLELRTRPRSRRPLWIDAICINQSSTAEKNQQVPLMGKIFSQAQRVIMWLGEEENNSKLAIGLIERWGIGLHKAHKSKYDDLKSDHLKTALEFIDDPFDDASLTAAEFLLARDYWKRMWIIQEVVLARSGLMICGREEVDFDDVVSVHMLWTTFASLSKDDLAGYNIVTKMSTRVNLASTSLAGIRNLIRHRIAATSNGRPWLPDILHLAMEFENQLCSDPRDRIFGLYGFLAGQELPMHPTYQLSVAEVYGNFTRSYIESSNRLDIVSLAGVGVFIGAKQTTMTVPSWIPDFLNTKNRLSFAFYEGFFRPNHQAARRFTARAQFQASELGNVQLLRAASAVCEEISDLIQPESESLLETGLDKMWDWLKLAETCNEYDNQRGTPWRQAFFRTVIAHTILSLPGKTVAADPGSQGLFALSDQAEGFMTLMRAIAWWKISPVIRKSENNINGWSDIDEADISFDATLLEIPRLVNEGIIDSEAAYWLYNSSTNSDETLRIEALASFCGSSASPHHIDWPFTKYACSAQTMNFHRTLLTLRAITPNRSFFITPTGYMGLGPRYAKKGDKICILLGCSVPVVIRKTSTNYVIVGDAYIHGMMQGEMMDQVKSGKLKIEELTFE